MTRADEPLTHITRTALPWREATKTVCGHPVAQYPAGLVVNLADARVMQRRLGKQRFALAICMTCAHNVGHWVEWDENPIGRMEREVTGGAFGKREPVLEAELRAIAALIELHREEFDDLVSSYVNRDVVTMAQLRRQRAGRDPGGAS